MAAQSHDDKLLIHFFQDSLTGSAARWYVQLDRNSIKTWKDLARAFIAQYKHVAELAPDRLSLQTMKKKQSESFKEYAQRWRDTAAQVQPPLTDKEMTVLFINTLRAPFYERLIGNDTKNFADLVLSGEIIEGAIKSGKIEGHEITSSKKGSTPKKKEGDVQAVAHDSQQAHNFNPYYPGPKTTLERPKFDPIPVSYTTLLPQLIENRLLARTPLQPLRPPFPKWYDPNAHCDYHFGIQGHSTENCTALKHKVQALIKAGLLNFAKKDSSSVDGNPLPNHGRSTENAIHEGMIRRVKKGIDEIQKSMDKVFEALSKMNVITPEPIDTKELGHDLAYSCKFHMGAIGHSIQNCDSFLGKLQELMDSSVIEFYEEAEENLVGTINGDTPDEVASSSFGANKPKPLTIFYEENRSPMNDTSPTMIRSGITIEVPNPFPYKSDKAVPWNYECNILGTASSAPQASYENLTGVGGITRSGRCYSPEITERFGKGKPAQGEGGLKKAYTFSKDQVDESVATPNNEVKNPVTEKEAGEFLKFIKHSEYSVVEQLTKMPARTSLLSLLLNSEAHRNALLKVLNQAYVAPDISVEKLDHIVGNITVGNFIAFNDEEIPSGGRGSNKALHITIKCKDHAVPRVLVDNGSALNVMPRSTLTKLLVDVSYMRTSRMVVRAFDGTTREVVGDIELPIKIGPCIFEVQFQVMDIAPSYNCLMRWRREYLPIPRSNKKYRAKSVQVFETALLGDYSILIKILD
ncbi:PREDICTED: uncharacterized protein LOC108662712 [Theobroma cacao]|uniref:Uncharacterized protein LOC108662712 n=1 Tax=Theobroma cacao TaxID=3641 RepID=A0AB32WL00_THECC|nr:PREDICTED: uncharacterized protein LOC108662712 [Theobroma cacao]